MKFEIIESDKLLALRGDIWMEGLTLDELLSSLARILFGPRQGWAAFSPETSVSERLLLTVEEVSRNDWLVRRADRFIARLTCDEAFAVICRILLLGQESFSGLRTYEQHKGDWYADHLRRPVLALIGGPR